MDDKLPVGWRCGEKTDPFQKTNICLVRWEELPEEEKQKDHDMVQGFP